MATLTEKDYKEFVELVTRMREVQLGVVKMEGFAYKWTANDHLKYDALRMEQQDLESEVDEYLKKMTE